MPLSKVFQRILLVPVLIMGLGVLLSSALVYISHNVVIDKVSLHSQKKSLIEDMYSNIGYGGSIHAFKNYVLRQDERYAIRAEQSLEHVLQSIATYRQLKDVSSAELTSLDDIERVVIKYRNNIDLAEQMVGQGATAEQVDNKVKVDDQPALNAFATLENILNSHGDEVSSALINISWINIAILFVMFAIKAAATFLISRRISDDVVGSIHDVTALSDRIANGEKPEENIKNKDYSAEELKLLAERIQLMGSKLLAYNQELKATNQLESQIQSLTLIFSRHSTLQLAATDLIRFLVQHYAMSAGKLHLIAEQGIVECARYGLTQTSNEAPASPNYLISHTVPTKFETLPQGCLQAETSFGSATPGVLLVIPIRVKNELIAVAELAGFTDVDENDEFCEKALPIIADGLNALLIQTENEKLLKESQEQTAQLEEQQEELQATNEELEHQSRELELHSASLDEANHELQKIRDNLEFKAAELTKINQYKSEFLANMSHEFRTPLNSLMVLSSLLIESHDENISAKHREYLRSIYQSGEDLLSLVEDILDLTKIEANKIAITPDKFSLSALIDEIDQSFDPLFKNKNLSWKIEYESNAQNTAIVTDRKRLKQILRNLISNALKFTPEGEVSLKIDASNDTVSFTVSDTGIGIDALKLDTVFNAFEQGDSSIDRSFGGTGLGLTISQELAFLLGGNITVSSEKGVGSVFTLTVATDVSDEVPRERIVKPPVSKSRTPLPDIDNDRKLAEKIKEIADLDSDRPVLFVIEDDAAFANIVCEQAREKSMQCIIIESGDLALTLFEHHTPDAVLLDVRLPNLSGMTILEYLKSRPQTRHVPVHMISAINYQTNALRRGAVGYLTKPLTIEKVGSALERISRIIKTEERRILLIEDNREQQLAIKQLLESDKTEIVACEHGEKAVSLLQESTFDTIVLDLRLPDTTGMAFLEQINALEISLPPIVIYTGKDLDREEEDLLLDLSDSIILKGARSPERLLDEINLFLHRVETALPPEQQQLLAKTREVQNEFSGRKILFVDDDLRNIFALTSALENRGFEVVIAKNGSEALSHLEKDKTIELVLTDVMMPVMNGYELIKAIRAPSYERNTMPVIALTAKAGDDEHKKVVSLGANDYLAKPVNLTSLISVLRVWLPMKSMFQ